MEELDCCAQKLCHSQCDPKLNNPFCHDTKCQNCNITILKLADAELYACWCCGYHICKQCQELTGINYTNNTMPCPNCKLNE